MQISKNFNLLFLSEVGHDNHDDLPDALQKNNSKKSNLTKKT